MERQNSQQRYKIMRVLWSASPACHGYSAFGSRLLAEASAINTFESSQNQRIYSYGNRGKFYYYILESVNGRNAAGSLW